MRELDKQALDRFLTTPPESELEENESFTEEDIEEELSEADSLDAEYNAEFPVSSEPELIAQVPLEQTSEEASLNSESEDQTPHLASTVCDCCLELNLTHPAQIIKCERCEQAFCFHYASNIDARYCVNCMSDVSVTKQIVSKEYIHKDLNSKITSVYRRHAREIKISGLSWLFAQRKIAGLTEVETDLSIEYHRNILILLLDSQERQRNAKMHRYAGVKVKIPTPTGSTVVTDTTQTTVKKIRTISKNKASEQLSALLSTMVPKGTDMNKIADILKGLKP